SEFKDGFSDPAENARAALALGEAAYAAKETRRALSAFSEAYDRSENPSDQLYARERARALAAEIAPDAARALYNQAPKDGPAAAVLAPRIARDLMADSKESQAADVLSDTRAARLAILGTAEVEGLSVKGSDTQAIGAVIPLTGKTWRIGRLFLRGLFFAAH